ncbi:MULTISPECIES: hypothetical protein [Cohnella]|uniref:Uncharacterized protein n=1 Tax=Cohnella phaseoli TaxID=456490 RepID=A0A3D9IRJ4_9BACL|nr:MULTISPECIES: hypothetical protein [Cohnella]RED64325.1 hypothetical protein DFP98_124139 [Cohnella phaseoli]
MLPADHDRVTPDANDEGIFTPDEVNEILKQLEEEQARARSDR